MAVTPQSVQAEIDVAVNDLEATTLSWPQMVKKYGADWTTWPTTTDWWKALASLRQARSDVGQLVAPTTPTLAVVISGTAQVGKVLTATASGA